MIASICGTGGLQDHLAIVVGISQLVHYLTVLAIVLGVTVPLPTLVNWLRFHILVHQARILTISILLY